MVPHLRRSRAALEEVVRRLEAVNTGLGSRLALTKEEIRGARREAQQAAAAGREAQAGREAAEQQCKALRGTVEAERARRVASLIRLQARPNQSIGRDLTTSLSGPFETHTCHKSIVIRKFPSFPLSFTCLLHSLLRSCRTSSPACWRLLTTILRV